LKQLILLFIIVIISGCGKNGTVFILEPEPGLTITVSGIKTSKPERRVNGVIVIENKAESFVKVSNRELFLYCGNDSARAFVALAGKWQIDDGLINVLKDKKIILQVYWPLMPPAQQAGFNVKYVKLIDRGAPALEEN
jgi:hypothetical protein